MRFYYLIDLHYSQTRRNRNLQFAPFYYLIDLHYSQTHYTYTSTPLSFYYLIDLHYSQTLSGVYGGVIEVLLPYRFTLFSNIHIKISAEHTVLLPYRFTLFSNLQKLRRKQIKFYYLIDLHYSQTNEALTYLGISFYYLIDLHYSQTEVVATYNEFSFTTL